ncbi:hypothetical protein PIB30_034993 [Stylosanthes scabra]|uniref:Uncharacterized protein n=1 Tax=Stylosanthes scabra TaxID=79078 RepID=A0ABU6RD27_9FABA|nr:hypothetical protein [Stylosanthes scabra]
MAKNGTGTENDFGGRDGEREGIPVPAPLTPLGPEGKGDSKNLSREMLLLEGGASDSAEQVGWRVDKGGSCGDAESMEGSDYGRNLVWYQMQEALSAVTLHLWPLPPASCSTFFSGYTDTHRQNSMNRPVTPPSCRPSPLPLTS